MSGAQFVHGLVQITVFGCIRINHLRKETDLLGGLYEILKTDGEVTNPGTSFKELLENLTGVIKHEILVMGCFWKSNGARGDLTI